MCLEELQTRFLDIGHFAEIVLADIVYCHHSPRVPSIQALSMKITNDALLIWFST